MPSVSPSMTKIARRMEAEAAAGLAASADVVFEGARGRAPVNLSQNITSDERGNMQSVAWRMTQFFSTLPIHGKDALVALHFGRKAGTKTRHFIMLSDEDGGEFGDGGRDGGVKLAHNLQEMKDNGEAFRAAWAGASLDLTAFPVFSAIDGVSCAHGFPVVVRKTTDGRGGWVACREGSAGPEYAAGRGDAPAAADVDGFVFGTAAAAAAALSGEAAA